MSYFGLHTTKKVERDAVIQTPYELINISPYDFHTTDTHKPIICEEGTLKYYQHDIHPFLETLKMMEAGKVNIYETPYYKYWEYKGTEVETRLRNLPALVKDIKENGIKEPVSCEVTGERLDGSFRTKIAIYLGIKKLKAKLYQFNWRNIDEDFLVRKMTTRELSSPKDYYEFDYGYKDWKNIKVGGEVYRENATDRWEVLKDLVKGQKVLDIGCNEGFMSLQVALQGKEVVGIDHEWNHLAYLNKLIFEWINKRDLKAKFIEGDISKQDVSGFDEVLLLNVLYHLPREKQTELLQKLKGSRLIFQCNLRKERERQNYYTSHPDDLKDLLTQQGFKIERQINWRDKPIIICNL